MATSALVGLDIEVGLRVVSVLENAGIALKVALWMATSEYEEGRLVLASPSLDQSRPLLAYHKVAELLQGESFHSRPAILILRMKDPFINSLRQMFGKTKSIEGMRLGGQMIGNRFILDGYVYRIQ
jgi:hypothetical protein